MKELIKINDLDLFLIGNSRKTNWKSMAEHIMLTEDQEWEQVGQYSDAFKGNRLKKAMQF